jgi:hypothetical protein
MTPDDILRSVVSVFMELVALSSCDALTASDSGFSAAAASWGGIPVENLRLLPRFTDSQAGGRCPASALVSDFYTRNRL